MAKIKPGTPHPSKRGLVMGTNGRYVAKSTYNKQVKAAKTSPSKPVTKTKPPAAKPAQKALPPKATTGGRRYSSGTASSRRAQAAAKQTRAAQGTTGTTVRQGQPAGAANRRYGADRVARSVRRAQVETAVRGAGRRLRGAGSRLRGAGPVGAILTGAEIAEAYKKTNRVKAESGRGAGRKTFNEKTDKPKDKNKVKPAKRGMSNIPPQEGTGRGSPNDKKPAQRQNATPKAQPKPKPKAKKGNGVSGVGPIKDGRKYSVGASKKSVTQQHADNLKKMGTSSERFKKLAADAKKKSLEQGKKNREGRNKKRRNARG